MNSLLKRRKNKDDSALVSPEPSQERLPKQLIRLEPLESITSEKRKNASLKKPTSPNGQTKKENISPENADPNHLPIIKPSGNNSNNETLTKILPTKNVHYKNQEEFCQAVCEARLMNKFNDIRCFLERVYSSFEEILKVFKVSSSEETSSENLDIDLEYLDYMHESLIRMPKEVQKSSLRSIINCMLHDQRRERTLDDLRVFPVLLMNPLFNDSSTYVIFAHVLRQTAVLSNSEHYTLIEWFQLLEIKDFKAMIERIKGIVNYKMLFERPRERMSGQSVGSPWWIPQSVKVLALLNATNEKCSSLLVPRDTFYIKGADGIDLVKEYDMWQAGVTSFSFCQYPFLLSLAAKRLIMQKDSETKMLQEARQALVDKVRKKQAPSMGMLFLNLNIRRKYILQDSLREISVKQKDLKKKLRVVFTGEPGIDLGGVSKEWFVLLMQKLYNADFGMFKYNNKTHTWWFNASCKENFQEYNLCGVLLGLAMYNGINLDVRFPPCLYRKLLSPAIVPYNNPHAPVGVTSMTLDDMKQVYPDVANGLHELLDYNGDVVEDFCQTFQISFTEYGQALTRNLKPQGETIPVTNDNRKEYVNLYIDYMLNKCIYQQFYSFYHGFHSVCASNALLLLRPAEVETLVIGNADFSITELEKITTYDGYTKSDNTIRYFWQTVYEMSTKLQKKFLFFCTGSDRIPVGGMKEMKFKITRVMSSNACKMLPMAHTCFNQLCLPPYKSRKTLCKKLTIAIENSEGFGIE